jgi:Mg2+ and Co2+ transporter CorA
MVPQYFAYGVFGIILDADENADFFEKFKDKVEELKEHGDSISINEIIDDICDEFPETVDNLRDRYDALDGVIFHSGLEKDRPGICNTPPDIFIFGYNMLNMPSQHISRRFACEASLHTWVEKAS